ncbi:MAG: tripartite tricarboxylate transporter substrate binding protein [Burkholderiaceae bacterium]|nr:tripartite tricarboxylate transporter substrate binding protein [Burkholderiaceae bacterium]MDO9090299.1 tripartite tricarboxylate transporter substrate binding protein [Burkholderiaceae bacterium]
MKQVIKALGAVMALTLATVQPAWSQAYPAAPIKVIIPTAPGGLSDPVVRFLSDQFQREFGHPMVMDYRAGGGGVIATQGLVKAAPDGYTLMLGNIGPVIFTPALNPKVVTYNALKDIVPVGSLVTFGNAVLLNPAVPAKNVTELIQLARQKPGSINFASSGNGQSHHLTGEMFKRMAGVEMTHVPYKGSGPAMTDVISGQVQMMFGNIPAALPFIKQGQLKVLAVTSPRRSSALPDVPTVAESGLPGFNVVSWVGMFAPAGTPKAITDRLNEAMEKAWATPEGQKLLASLAFDLVKGSPAELSRFMENETNRWGKLIREANIKVD